MGLDARGAGAPCNGSDDAQSLAARFRDAWSRAFHARDIDALAALYAPDALFFGSVPDLFCGRAGVRGYFASLRADIVLEEFSVPAVAQAGPDAIITAGYWRFRFGGEIRPYRLTWTLARRDGEWLIAAHHASPR